MKEETTHTHTNTLTAHSLIHPHSHSPHSHAYIPSATQRGSQQCALRTNRLLRAADSPCQGTNHHHSAPTLSKGKKEGTILVIIKKGWNLGEGDEERGGGRLTKEGRKRPQRERNGEGERDHRTDPFSLTQRVLPFLKLE